MLCEGSVQEVMDLTAVAHCAALEGKIPFINFFDGFRTSHEIQKIEAWDYEDLREMVNMDAVNAFRARALNPEHPVPVSYTHLVAAVKAAQSGNRRRFSPPRCRNCGDRTSIVRIMRAPRYA